jgi:hypothetical protein
MAANTTSSKVVAERRSFLKLAGAGAASGGAALVGRRRGRGAIARGKQERRKKWCTWRCW